MGSITRPLDNRLNWSVKLSTTWKGIIIAEGLEEPSVINEFDVYRARISKQDELIDDQGNKERWHLYWVRATDKQVETLTSRIRNGWYAHFWKGRKRLVVVRGKKGGLQAKEKSTWKEAVEYGKSVGIPEEQLDFPTNYIPWPSFAVSLIEQVGTNKRFFLML